MWICLESTVRRQVRLVDQNSVRNHLVISSISVSRMTDEPGLGRHANMHTAVWSEWFLLRYLGRY